MPVPFFQTDIQSDTPKIFTKVSSNSAQLVGRWRGGGTVGGSRQIGKVRSGPPQVETESNQKKKLSPSSFLTYGN
jgi:hypothetical protein